MILMWRYVLKGGVPCLECGKTYPIEEYDEDTWTKFYDEDGMEFDICPKCSKEGGEVTQPAMNIKDKEGLE